MHKILVIDDDEALRHTVTTALKKNRFRVLQARNGTEGVKIVRAERVDLILCDLNLGDTDGAPAVSLFRKTPATAEVPFILMTGNAVDADSPHEILLKPFTLAVLLSKVRKHLKSDKNIRLLVGQEEKVAVQNSRQRQCHRPFAIIPQRELSREQMEKVLSRAETTREEEKSRIARRIHDDLSQKLTVLAIDLSLLENSFKSPTEKTQSPENLKKIRQLGQLVNEIIDAAQDITAELRPKILDEFGIVAALEWLAQRFEKFTGIKCALHNPTGDELHYPSIGGEVYRLAEALLSNVARHSGATQVRICIEKRAETLCLEVSDDGRGITPKQVVAPTSLGLLAMRERLQHLRGAFEIKGELGKGTIVSAQVPLETNFRQE